MSGGMAWYERDWHGAACGMAWHLYSMCYAWHESGWHGASLQRHGMARHGMARHGTARHGMRVIGVAGMRLAWHGTAWQWLARCSAWHDRRGMPREVATVASPGSS